MKIYKSHQQRLYFQSTNGLIHNLKLIYRKIHKNERAIRFIELCLEHGVQPKFCKVQEALESQFNKDEIHNIQRNLKTELQKQRNLMPLLKNNFGAVILDYQLTTKNNFEFESSENDRKRDRKFRILINEKSRNFSKVEVFNLSTKTVPVEIINFLS
jgi:hypothetical protein